MMTKVTFPLTHCNLLILLSDSGYELSDTYEAYLQKARFGRAGEFFSIIRAKQADCRIELAVIENYADADKTITVKCTQSESLMRDFYETVAGGDLYTTVFQYADIYPLTESFRSSLEYSAKQIAKLFAENC
ncbi:hypothetical protein [Enterobacter hormaechei]|nr:hypothetical protein [Enterobacter hormaechei]